MHPVLRRLGLAAAAWLTAVGPAGAQPGRPAGTPRADAFSRVHCGADSATLLVGATLPNGPVAAIQAAHADIRLTDVGSSEIDDATSLDGWQMCGHEYELLVRGNRVVDAIRIPPHSRRQPAFLGACTQGGKRVTHVLAVLDNPAPRTKGQPPYPPDDTTSLQAITAWRVDARTRRLVATPTSGLRCPRSGIFTVDGGT